MSKNKNKVLFVATVASHIRSFHLPYLKMFQDNGYKTFVAGNWNIKDQKKLDYCDKFVQIPIRRSPYSLQNLKAIKELRRVINKEHFDIIHCHTPMGAVVARLAAKKARKKYGTRVIYTAHGFHFYNGASKKNWLLFYPVEWYLSKFTDTLITINKEDYNRAERDFGNRCKEIRYVPGVGVDLEGFSKKIDVRQKLELRKKLGFADDDKIIICIGRLDKNKNQGFLIYMMNELIQKSKKYQLLLVGPDELNGEYQKLAREVGVLDNVHFLGLRRDVSNLMQISDVVVSASRREGLPVNIMEALATGKPIVALDCRGVRDLIIDGENGYVVNNIREMMNRILLLDNDGKKMNRFVKEDKKELKKYSLKSVSERMRDIYFNCTIN